MANMVLSNKTKNQHFVSQAEQRLNARPTASDSEPPKIYAFRVEDRDKRLLKLEKPKGVSIGNNLSMLDLFSFDVENCHGIRSNFEALFHKYETNITLHTESLLKKSSQASPDVKTEIIELFAAKFLNFVRNPYGVQKVLNSFPELATYEPTDPILLAEYLRIMNGRKPHQNFRCKELGITDSMYIGWLRTLFMLLVPLGKQSNMLEEIIKTFVLNPKTITNVSIFHYESKCCLLSDRGYCQMVPDGPHMAFAFNLCRNAFITYMFADIDKLPPSFPRKDIVERYKSEHSSEINVIYVPNNQQMLEIYNARVIEQCHERVFCASKEFDVLSVPFD